MSFVCNRINSKLLLYVGIANVSGHCIVDIKIVNSNGKFVRILICVACELFAGE